MDSQITALKALKPEKDFFIGIDSDGCTFDSMEIKHKECFCPAFINHYGLQPVSKYAREAWEFVNLYSKTRGCNRFLAVIAALSLLSERKEVIARGVKIPEMTGLKEWIKRETKLGNPALKTEVEKTDNPDLKRAYKWSLEVNETIGKIVRNVPPYPFVKECLQKINEKADAIVVSQTPFDALSREWKEHRISDQVRMIAGQEMGTKTEHLDYAAGGKYEKTCVLMIGDAPGDLKAAKANGVLFFPVNPGHEESSWEVFHNEALNRFFEGSYAGSYEEKLINDFNTYLPENPPWAG